MNYGEMLANSIVSNDGSTYASNAGKALESALEAGKAANEMSNNMIANAAFATDSLVKAVGTASTTTKDKDGNITTTPGTGFVGMAESAEDFAGRSFDLTNAINENTAEYKNYTFNAVLEAQKEEYELISNDNSVKNLELSTDTEINKTLAQNNSSLNIGKVKAYLTNPNLINEAVKSGELTDADAVMLRNMQQQGISDAIAQSNKLKLMKEYTDNGWLTEENLFRLAKIRSEDPFAKLAGLSTIDIYARLAEEQRVARNQGKMTNDMFDLNYSVNRNLLDGNRAINNGQYGNNQANGNSNVATNGSVRTNQANMNTSANNANANNQQQVDDNTSSLDDDTSKYVSNIRFDNGKTQIDFTPEGEQAAIQHRQNFEDFADETFYKPGQETNTIWEGTKGAIKAVWDSPASYLLMGGVAGFGLKYLGGMALRHAPKLLGLAKDGAVATMEYVLSDILAADGKEAMETMEKFGKDRRKIIEEMNSELSKTKDLTARNEIRKKYHNQVNELYKSSPVFGNENTAEWMKKNGYSDKIQKAFAKNDTKELERLAKEVSNNKEFQKLARTNASAGRTTLKGAKTAAGRTIGSAFTGKLSMTGIILSGLSFGGGIVYNMLDSDDEHKNNNTYDKFKNGISELQQLNPDARTKRNWENTGEDTTSHFITNSGGGTVGNNTLAFLKGFDYEQIRQNIADDYKNGKISQKEAQLRTQEINKAQKAAEAVKFQDDIIQKAELQNPNSRENALRNPITANPDDLENNIQSRAAYNTQKTHIPTTMNKLLDGGNPHQKDNTNVSPIAGLMLSSVNARNITEVNIKGVTFPVDTKLSPSDKVSYDFLTMKDAPEGTTIPLSAAIIKDCIVSNLNNSDLMTANYYKSLKDKGLDEKLVLLDNYMQMGKDGKTKAYTVLQEILTMVADTAAEQLPGGLVTENGSSRINNKDFGELLRGKKDFSIDRLGSELLNNIEATYDLQSILRNPNNNSKIKEEHFNQFMVANIFGNAKRIRARIEEYEKALKREKDKKEKK